MLDQELNHRVKNMLAMVVSMVQQTLADLPGAEESRETQVGRLNAMCRACALLSEDHWTQTPLLRRLH